MRRANVGVLLAALLVAPCALAQPGLETLADRAAKLPPSPARYIQTMKFGIRGVTFRYMAVAPSDSKTIYATSYNGFVYASHDGGLTWEEGRLITERVKFFGAIRPSDAPNGAGLRLLFPWGYDVHEGWDLEFDGLEYVGIQLPGEKGVRERGLALPDIQLRLRDSGGGGGAGGDSSRFGVGIVRAAPRLQALLKKKGARLIGLNLKLLLNVKGLEPTWVQHVAIHPTNPKIAFVATAMGLYKTTDGGVGWLDVFTGRSNFERWGEFVAFDPSDPQKVWLGTRQGLLSSTDGGERFVRVSGTQLSSLRATWLEFHPKHPKIIYAGSNNGAFRSDDGGRNWKWIFYETLPQANYIRAIALDPTDPDRVQLATEDGMYRSRDGGKNWERSGGFLFTSQWVTRAISDPEDPNHLIATTYLNVWETFDWGETWSAMYINDSDWSPRMIMFDPDEKGVFWVVTSSEILKLTPNPPAQPDPARLAALQEQLKLEPTLSEVHDAAFRVHASHVGEHAALRTRARLSALMPRLTAWAGYLKVDSDIGIRGLGISDLGGTPDGADDTIPGVLQRGYFYAGGMATWDLQPLIFHVEEAPYGRYFEQMNLVYLRVKYEVQRLHEERRRLLIKLVTVPPDDVRALLNMRMRLEELTAHLNRLSGGLFEPQLRLLEETEWVQ